MEADRFARGRNRAPERERRCAMHLPTQRLSTFLTFNGNAREAMEFYAAAVPGARIESLALFGEDAPNGDEGTVLNGSLSIGDANLLFMDMQAASPAPAFSWATSLFLACADEDEFDRAFAGLSQDGAVMMGPEPVMDLRKVAWVTDRFGVTWQMVWD